MDKLLKERINESYISSGWESSREVIQRLIASKKCEKVWKALEKRMPEAEKRRQKEFAGWMDKSRDDLRSSSLADGRSPEEIDQLTQLERLSPESLFFGVVNCVDTGLKEMKPFDDASVAERSAVSIRMCTAIDTLLDDLKGPYFSDGEHFLPPLELHLSLGNELNAIRAELYSWIGKWSTRPIDGWVKEIGGEATFFAFYQAPPRTLIALRRGIEDWGKRKPMITRPNDPNAKRLRLIRILTAHFRKTYGTPLYGCTLAITSVFFNCDGLSESVIAKLAKPRPE